jgi:mono/diheme cytochrome c family protein
MLFTAGLIVANTYYAPAAYSGVSAQGAPSVWDGVYTAEQAKRGEAPYMQGCMRCHGQDLMGGEMAPALSDGQFRSNWDGVPVGELFERIRVSMPADNPGGMSRQQYADILAYVFFKGGFPAGTTELPSRTEMLQVIMFKATKP